MQGRMSGATDKETTGAWFVHHRRTLAHDANGAAAFPAIDEAAKAALQGMRCLDCWAYPKPSA